MTWLLLLVIIKNISLILLLLLDFKKLSNKEILIRDKNSNKPDREALFVCSKK